MIHYRKPDFTQGFLQTILHYDINSGIWTRKIVRHARGCIGERAGCINKSDGRRYIKVKSKRYSESRLAWFYMKGTWPKREVEHADADYTNNSWSNLRLASRSQNQGNAKSLRKFKGVTQVRTGKFTAQIQCSKRKRHLGTFDTPEAAHNAYIVAAAKLFGQFARSA